MGDNKQLQQKDAITELMFQVITITQRLVQYILSKCRLRHPKCSITNWYKIIIIGW